MHTELDAWGPHSKLRPKASLLTGFPQSKRATEQSAPFVGGGRQAAPFMEAGFRLEFSIVLPSIKFVCV